MGAEKIVLEVAGCESDPCELPTFLEKQFEVCSIEERLNLNVTETSDAKENWIIEWSPAEYVDDKNALSPNFIHPGGTGTVNLTLKISTICSSILPDSYGKKENILVKFSNGKAPNLTVNQVSDLEFEINAEPNSELIITIPQTNYTSSFILKDKTNWTFPTSKIY